MRDTTCVLWEYGDTNGQALTGDHDRIFTVLNGDVTGDLFTNVFDLSALWAQRTDQVLPSEEMAVRADVNQDGKVNVFDLSAMWEQRNHNAQEITNPQPTTDTLTDYLINQIVPNSDFETVVSGREGLLQGLSIANGETGTVLARSWGYDNAISIVGLVMAGKRAEAAEVIDALIQTNTNNGDLFFSVNLNDEGHSDLIRTGANSWVGYAVNYFVLTALHNNPNALNENPMLQDYLDFAQEIALAVMNRQVLDTIDPRHGLITGGLGTFVYTLDDQNNLVETFDPGERTWVSTEHNIDAYFFLRDLAFTNRERRVPTSCKPNS